MSDTPSKILYCRCAFAKVVPDGVKTEVLDGLCESGKSFESVADLCEMAARKDPRIQTLLDESGTTRIAACYPRAVKWLFHQAEAPFPSDDQVEVINMREEKAPDILEKLLKS